MPTYFDRNVRPARPHRELGSTVFNIANANLGAPFVPGSLEPGIQSRDLLAQFSVTEGWSGDLSSGSISLGEWGTALHGLPSRECGLLSLMRCYDPRDHRRIIELFEQAATSPSSFCFSTTIATKAGQRQPLFCMGESSGLERKYAGRIIGVFIFPRFKLDAGSTVAGPGKRIAAV